MKILNGEKSRIKSFVGGAFLGGLVGLLAGGFVTASIMATAFINANI